MSYGSIVTPSRQGDDTPSYGAHNEMSAGTWMPVFTKFVTRGEKTGVVYSSVNSGSTLMPIPKKVWNGRVRDNTTFAVAAEELSLVPDVLYAMRKFTPKAR